MFLLLAFGVMTAPAYAGADAGKATYDKACAACHGQGGIGNPTADQFWRMKLPRPTDKYFQSKSDAELKNVIENGTRKMPKATDFKVTTSTEHRTKVTEAEIPDLIAYIRTLKK
jgi:mono/diheme cytochrome c family protein